MDATDITEGSLLKNLETDSLNYSQNITSGRKNMSRDHLTFRQYRSFPTY